MTGSIRIFEKLNFTPKLSALAFLKVKLPNMTDWHMSFSNLDFVVVVNAANVVLSFFLVLTKMAFSDVSQKYDVIIRIFEILKYQNIPALTVWPIVPITFLILNNHQSARC